LNYCIAKDFVAPIKDLRAFKVFKEAVYIVLFKGGRIA